MRLVAELLDKTSGPLKDIQKSLRDTRDLAKGIHVQGAAQAKAHAAAYKELGESIRKIKDVALDVVQPGLAALGLTSLTVAGAIAAVTAAVKGLGDASQTLTFINRQSGVTINLIRGLAEAGQAYGITAEATNAGLAKFGAFMDQNARRAPDALNAWNQMPGAWARIGRSLVGLNRDAQVNKVLDFLPSVRYQDQRRKLLAIMGLPEDWANLSREEIQKMREAGDRFNQMHPFALENAKKSKEAWDAIASSLRGIRDDMGAAFGPDVVEGVERIQTFLDDKDNIESFKAAFRGIAAEIRDGVTFIRDLVLAMEGAMAKLKELGAYKSKPFAQAEDPMGSDYVTGQRPSWMFSHIEKKAFPGDLSNLTPWAKEPKSIQEPVRKGVKEGLDDFNSSLIKQKNDGSYTPMAFHPDGGGAGGRGWGGGGYGLVPDGRAPGGSRGGGGAIPDDVGHAPNSYAGGGGPIGDGTGINRDKWRDQLDANRALKDRFFRHSLGENTDPQANQAIMESAANRADIRGNKRFDDHGNLSYFQGYYRGAITPKMQKMLDDNYRKVFTEGSDISKGAIDNSSQWLSAKHERNGRFKTTANFGGDRITGHRGVESFEIPGWGESGAGERARYSTWRMNQLEEAAQRRLASARATHGAALGDHIRHGRKRATDGTLLDKRSDAGGGLTGTANLTIDLNGFPRGTRTAARADGLFKQVTLNRGRPMSPASETG